MLDKDAATLSMRFDVEASAAEVDRLQRRHREIEQHMATLAQQLQQQQQQHHATSGKKGEMNKRHCLQDATPALNP